MQIAADLDQQKPFLPITPAPEAGLEDDGRFTVDVVSSVERLEALAAEWNALEALSGADAVFQSFAQIRVWAKHFLGRRGARLHVAVVRDAGRAVLILPAAIAGPPLLRIASIAGDPVAQYAELLLDPALASQGAFNAALLSLRKAGADALVLRGVRADSHLFRLAAPRLRSPAAETVAPCADLSGFEDFPAYLKSLSKKVRQALRHRHNHLNRAGDFRFEILRGAEARAAVADAMDLKRKWLVQRGNLSSAFLDPATRDCLLALAATEETGAVVGRLVIGEEAAAIRFGFEYRGTHFAYLSAFDPRFADVSPGKLLMEYCLSGFRVRGFERIDMLPPEGAHKRDWCRQEVSVADYSIPLSAAGRAYAGLYQERFRPALKRAFNHLPVTLRSLIAVVFVSI